MGRIRIGMRSGLLHAALDDAEICTNQRNSHLMILHESRSETFNTNSKLNNNGDV